MQTINQIEMPCPDCKMVRFKFGEEILSYGHFKCPVCQTDIFGSHVKPAITEMRSRNRANRYLRENKITLFKGDAEILDDK